MDDSAYPPLHPEAVLWSDADPESEAPLIVLLHGYGSNEHDLFSLVPHLPEAYDYAAVQAPLAPAWPMPGYAWYSIESLHSRDPAQITQAAQRLIEWADACAPARQIGLLGFSQGAAVALHAMRVSPERFAFALNISGYVTPDALAGDEQLAANPPPVFWGRGGRDDIIPEALIAHTVDWLPQHSVLSGRLYPDLGHAVSQEELADIHTFLTKQLERPAETPAGENQQ